MRNSYTSLFLSKRKINSNCKPSQPQEKEEENIWEPFGRGGGVREQIWSAKSTCKKNTQDKVKPTRISLERAPLAAS